jgi:DNA polymerase I
MSAGPTTRPRLFLVDSYGFIFRAYHARARTSAPPMRSSTGIPTEVVFIFSNMIKRVLATHKPDFIAAVFEGEGKTLREQEFAEYKANRSETPPDLIEQIPYVAKYLEAMRIPVVSAAGFEADDVIGSLARQAKERDMDVVIVSSDKDLLQLVNERVSMLNPMKEDILYDPKAVESFMGVPPHLVADLLALKGDSVDNIPGAPGIGDKGAKDLITEFGAVETLLDRAEEVKNKSYRESLQNNRDQVLLSKRLATIDINAPVELNLTGLTAQLPDAAKLRDLFRELEFYSQLKELGVVDDQKKRDYAEFKNENEVAEYLKSIPAASTIAFTLQPVGEGLLVEDFFGLSHEVGFGRSAPWSWIGAAQEFLQDSQRPKAMFDAKSLYTRLAEAQIGLSGVQHDVQLYSFLLQPESAAPGIEQLAERDLNRKVDDAAQAADVVLEMLQRYLPQMETRNLSRVFNQIDGPVAPVIAQLERTGIRVDRAQLGVMSQQMDQELQRLSKQIWDLAGKQFNINSPQQLGKVLYEDLGLPMPMKYGKGKQMSTAADILEELAQDHPIAGLVLEFRQIAKLKGTYVDALPQLLDGDGRVHTTFSMVTAATGRLSSYNPNLQNIPIRSELGRTIRRAFVPIPGWKLVSADYSQIELRLLAHMSEDPVLMDAFKKREDIHARTASEVFSVAPSEVTADMRRYAKSVNFGIIYGQTSYGLSQGLGISRQEADEFIRKYFATYKGVRTFIDQTVARAKETGITETLFGRQRPLVDIHSRNPNARHFAERVAVNAPLQGSAADLIKLAMIDIDQTARREGWKTRMLLQVHDELLFEGPPEEMATVVPEIQRRMAEVFPLRVPLEVDTNIGDSWSK